ncbi:amidohydrolase [Corynebacterium ulceribovis]|uniref:amidohydrolase n=1 Tax=Corynebacterium ulceribovis TaxID=487732 RepID=UPI000364C536|nr:amidohydrolase [Corynebacterium ulceribovis]
MSNIDSLCPDRIAELVATAPASLEWQSPFYRKMHANPELSGQEEQTAGRIAAKLRDIDGQILTGIGGHSVIHVMRNPADDGTPGPVVLLRADIDGLPVTENTGSPFASVATARNDQGELVGTMHACGHDMHTTAGLGATFMLDALRDKWAGTVVTLFQPAEETTSGAQAMLDDELAEKIPAPDVCLAQHIVPGPAGQVMSMAGPALAGCDTITITLSGQSAHASMPHNAIDPTYLAAMIVVRLQGIVGREVAPQEFAVVSVGTLQSGNSNNTIPQTAKLVLNCRYYSEAVRQQVTAAIERIARGEAIASGCLHEPTFEYSCRGEITDNSDAVFASVRPAFDAVFGDDSVDAQAWTASEDFSVIPRGLGAPYLYWTVGATPRELWATGKNIPSNHMDNFLPDEEPVMAATTKALAAAALANLAAR